MTRARSSFRQADITRGIAAHRKAGLTVIRTEIDKDGKLVFDCVPEGEKKQPARKEYRL